ncbi:type II toxin-antitoxin system VapB family antitoxin [Tahibacter caeni]|uniref:type II toxin-antitoxin system VapB family antitoxin n=1 Tax=Tahibacter caeni TaxID=1453545 RepID=UPI0021489CC0|nr:type II toxin-antitoxin system VapB family antitoxin [Tahibacter caeni]
MEKRTRTELTLDDTLITRARDLTGILELDALIAEALRAIIARESGRRLALLGGSEPKASAAPRRRPKRK